jgi:hypothetical protein
MAITISAAPQEVSTGVVYDSTESTVEILRELVCVLLCRTLVLCDVCSEPNVLEGNVGAWFVSHSLQY